MSARIGIDFNTLEIAKELGTSVNYVTRAAILDYVNAVEDYDPVFLNEEDARRAGYEKIIAPPGFHLQYTSMKWATGQAGYVPQGAVHVKQNYRIFALVFEGDCLNTIVSIAEKYEKNGRRYVVYKIEVTNQQGEIVCVSEMTNMLP